MGIAIPRLTTKQTGKKIISSGSHILAFTWLIQVGTLTCTSWRTDMCSHLSPVVVRVSLQIFSIRRELVVLRTFKIHSEGKRSQWRQDFLPRSIQFICIFRLGLSYPGSLGRSHSPHVVGFNICPVLPCPKHLTCWGSVFATSATGLGWLIWCLYPWCSVHALSPPCQYTAFLLISSLKLPPQTPGSFTVYAFISDSLQPIPVLCLHLDPWEIPAFQQILVHTLLFLGL